ncbi:MAG TPA: ATP-binding protein [Dermatophilaceae bacterium]|nr:ATP-binding protein [Dermatophilaceae bacterium]
MLLQLATAAFVVLLLVAFAGSWASQRLAERQAVNDAAQAADLMAEAVVQPTLSDGLVTGDPAAVAAVDSAVRQHVLGRASVRVKIWSPQGKVLYSDERRLVGQQFHLNDREQQALRDPSLQAEVSDLGEEENQFERGQGRLLEVYRPVWTPGGQTLLFETYAPYGPVSARASQLWRGFIGIMLSSLLILLLLLAPILWRLLRRLKQSQAAREHLLQRAVDASTEERERIAGTLHDGVVQDLAATSFAVSGAASRAAAAGQPRLARDLDAAAGTVRTSIAGLRSLLVDIYPPSMSAAGIGDALENLAAALRTRDVVVDIAMPPDRQTGLSESGDRLLFRVTQECLRNVSRHSRATSVSVKVRRDDSGCELTIADDGVGFDAQAVLSAPERGHFGLQVMRDLVRAEDGELAVRTSPGEGTVWRLRLPTP